ncbi:MAG: hypothetical protein NTW87_32420 [Planctomycetota bacterium]|nr:hypothetical protein [Planctomycetota bacterium]
MTTEEGLSAKTEGLKVFGASSQRPRPRPPSRWHWLRAGFLAFVGVLNLLAAIGLLASGVYLLATDKAEGGTGKAELRLGSFSIRSGEEPPQGAEMTAQQRARGTLAVACFALSLVPFSIAVLARVQYQMAREMAWQQPEPGGTEPQNE